MLNFDVASETIKQNLLNYNATHYSIVRSGQRKETREPPNILWKGQNLK